MNLTQKQRMQAYDVLIGECLAEERAKKGLTQPQVALLYKTSRQAISNYERGIRSINISNLLSLCDVCGFDAMKIMTKVKYASEQELQNAYTKYFETVSSLQ